MLYKLMDVMKKMVLAILLAAASPLLAEISGDYLEVRTCDVYTGPCFANAEMGLTGKEAILVWSVREGKWNNTALDGLKVIAVVKTDDTMGDQRYQPRSGKAVLVVDANANSEQREALLDFARARAGKLIAEVASVKDLDIQSNLGTCKAGGCAQVKAGNLIDINTRCLGDKDHACGNESAYYPPLTAVNGAVPGFTEMASFKGSELNVTFSHTGQRSAFLASF